MPESFDEALYNCQKAADVFVQAHAEQALKALQAKFAEIAKLPEGARVAGLAMGFSELFRLTERSYQAQSALVSTYTIDLGGGLVGIRADKPLPYQDATKVENALKTTLCVLQMFDRFSHQDFATNRACVMEKFAWLHQVIKGDVAPEIEAARAADLLPLARQRASVSIEELQTELLNQSLSSMDDLENDPVLEFVEARTESAMLSYGVLQRLVETNEDANDDAGSAEKAKIALMLQTLLSIHGLLDHPRLLDDAEYLERRDELQALFKAMDEFVAGALAYEPTAEELSAAQVTVSSLHDESAFAHGAMDAPGAEQFDEESLLTPTPKRSVH